MLFEIFIDFISTFYIVMFSNKGSINVSADNTL